MITFLAIVSFLLFMIFGVMFIWSLIKKNRKAKRNVLISAISFFLMIFLIVVDSDASDNDESVKENSEAEEAEKEKAEKAEKEKAEKEKAEKEKADKEKAEQEENERKEKSKENINEFTREKESHENISGENILIDDITTEIKNGVLTIKFQSFNQSGDLAVLEGLVTVTAEQSNDFLDEAFDLYDPKSENSYMHMIEDSASYVMEAQYKIRSVNDPIEIVFALPPDEDETWTEEIIELNLD